MPKNLSKEKIDARAPLLPIRETKRRSNSGSKATGSTSTSNFTPRPLETINLSKHDNKEMKMKPTESIKNSLGTLNGVFIPCSLNIMGIILFLRFGWSVGQAGVLGTIIILTVAEVMAVLTVLSFSAIYLLMDTYLTFPLISPENFISQIAQCGIYKKRPSGDMFPSTSYI